MVSPTIECLPRVRRWSRPACSRRTEARFFQQPLLSCPDGRLGGARRPASASVGTAGSGTPADNSNLPVVPMAILAAGVAVTGLGLARTKRAKV